MRDPLLNESMKRLAAEAATRFTMLVAGGAQIPFDVTEQAGPDSLFHSYEPLTGRFVTEHEAALRELPAFEPARDAMLGAEIAANLLEAAGEPVPFDPREAAARAIAVFFAGFWEGCSDFALDAERLDAALAVLDAEVRGIDESEVLVAPLVGLQMPAARLNLPHGMRILRGDAFDPPPEAMRSEGLSRRAWEPQFFAVADQGEGSDSAAAALRQLRELISVMRLFKAGGIGLGPYAFAPTGEDRWRRVATGSPAVRPGGYRLDEEEAAALAAFAERLEERPDPDGSLAWAVRRFELGCGRETAAEGLSDHLLALRAVLNGQGPVGASLPMRAATLVDSGPDRLVVRERFEAALEVERSLMNGGPGTAELAAWLEESVRAILRDAALGEIEGDLTTTADETLIASGLAEGDAAVAVTTDFPEPTAPAPIDGLAVGAAPAGPGGAATPSDRASSSDLSRGSEGKALVPEESAPGPDDPDRSAGWPVPEHPSPESLEEDEMSDEQQTRILEPIPAEDEIRITATNWLEEVEVEAEGDPGTIEWPAGVRASEPHERIDTPTVRRLFAVPDADWEVGELEYDHYQAGRGR